MSGDSNDTTAEQWLCVNGHVLMAHLALPAPVGPRAFLQLPFRKCAHILVEGNHTN